MKTPPFHDGGHQVENRKKTAHRTKVV